MIAIQTRDRGRKAPRNTTMTPRKAIQTQGRRRNPLRSATIAMTVTQTQGPRGNLQENITTRAIRMARVRKSLLRNAIVTATPTASLRRGLPRNTMRRVTLAQARAKMTGRANIKVPNKSLRHAKANTLRPPRRDTSESAMAAMHHRNITKDR